MAKPPQCQSEQRQHQGPLKQSSAIRLRSQALAVASGNWANARAGAPHESPFLRAINSWDELQRSCASYTRQLAEILISLGTHAVVSSTAPGLSAALADPTWHVKTIVTESSKEQDIEY
jgi:hypothetical protein